MFKRRNLIAHQSDRLHENGEKNEIERATVETFLEQIVKIVDAIQSCIEEKNETE